MEKIIILLNLLTWIFALFFIFYTMKIAKSTTQMNEILNSDIIFLKERFSQLISENVEKINKSKIDILNLSISVNELKKMIEKN